MTHLGRYVECKECNLERCSLAEHELGVEREEHVAEIAALNVRVVRLEQALRDQLTRWERSPSGVDDDAEENDPSPDDATAHEAGLAIRAIRAVLDEK